jgi:glutamate synthase domain-containing protein 2
MLLPVRVRFYCVVTAILTTIYITHYFWPPVIWFLGPILPLIALGFYDIFQTKNNILKNYPVWGHIRSLFLSIRPQIQQYFIVNDQDDRPFNKEMRDLVASRANKTLDTLPFGTQLDMDKSGYEWMAHSLQPCKAKKEGARVVVGNEQCLNPYYASRINISALSFGALSQNAIRALNLGAKLGDFAQNTGEGGLSRYHLMEGGDLIWQIGTGYFGCRNEDGTFSQENFSKNAQHHHVKMIEIKLSQGAKPAHGGILPGVKVSTEIAYARGVREGVDCNSPPAHSAFSTPKGLLEFVQRLRDLSGGKPVGFKLCLGVRSDFLSICKAMLELKIYPDFISIDGAEGGTGAAPVEFADHVGTPLTDALIFIHNALVGTGLRRHIKLIASGKIISGFDVLTKIALGADMCNVGRGMMFALGCVQARQCHSNKCPTGVTTQDPRRMYALNIQDKAPKVANFHKETLHSFLEVLGAAGIEYAEHLTPGHIHRRVGSTEEYTYDELYTYLSENAILEGSAPGEYLISWSSATAEKFAGVRNSDQNMINHHVYRREVDAQTLASSS